MANAIPKYIRILFSGFMCSCKIGNRTNNWSPMYFESVPNQDFTADSDIDWPLSMAGIDKQLYDKHRLAKAGKDYIETIIDPMEQRQGAELKQGSVPFYLVIFG